MPPLTFRASTSTSVFALLLCCLVSACSPGVLQAQISGRRASEKNDYQMVVYGGTSGGVAAAIQARRMGKSVILIEQGKHVGGLTSGGLGATDIGNKAAIGGVSREFYQNIGEHYENAAAWNWQKPGSYQPKRGNSADGAMWTFEPHVAENIYRTMLADAKVPVVYEQRLNRKTGVSKQDGRIVSITMESGETYRGQVFIDATYEGDLLAAAGVSYTVGREANSQYDETLNGVQAKMNVKNHRFYVPVDPYITPGDAESGLLPGIEANIPPDGTGDKKVQAYCFRMCTTDVKENQVDWVKPNDYDEQQYELLFRNFEAGDRHVPWNPVSMPNRKTDTNNNYGFSTDFIGQNYDYPEADYKTREQIFQRHLHYQQGLMWTLANHPRVPAEIRKHFQRLKPAKDEFTATDHWPHQLYVREARRMVSEYVMSQHDCQGRRIVDDPVGLAAYTMDSHNIQRYVTKDGHVQNEGDVQVGGFSPYPISYRSIRPKETECQNLLVPVCLSASHIAYGSIRMEPVFMVLGQSAATAASLAIDGNTSVQDVDYAALQQQLLKDKQVLAWTGPRKSAPMPIASLKGIVVDDTQATFTGTWRTSSSVGGYVGSGYRHDENMGIGEKQAVYALPIKTSGRYELRLFYTPNNNRATNVPVSIETSGGEKVVTVNQKKPADKNGSVSLGVFPFDAGTATVIISNTKANGHVIADAVQLLPMKP